MSVQWQLITTTAAAGSSPAATTNAPLVRENWAIAPAIALPMTTPVALAALSQLIASPAACLGATASSVR